MHQTALDLSRAAFPVGAEPLRLVFVLDQSASAIRADLGKLRSLEGCIPHTQLHGSDFRDDFSALLHIHIVPNSDVQKTHLVFVVQSCAFDCGSGEQHRVQIRHGSHRSSPSHLIINGFDLSQSLFCLEFVGHGPTRKLGCIAQILLVFQFIDFYDYAIGSERQSLPLCVPIIYIILDFSYSFADAAFVGHRKPPGLSGIKSLGMGLERQSLSDHMVERTFQPPFRNLCAVKQFQRTGSGITGICERLLLISGPFFVQTVKCRVWHIDFTPDFKFFRIVSAFQGLRYIADFLNVGRNIIAHLSVASGKSPHKATLAVGQANCSAVELELAGIGEILPGQKPGCPVGKIHDFTYVVGIA